MAVAAAFAFYLTGDNHPAPSRDMARPATGLIPNADQELLLQRNLSLPLRGLRLRDIQDTFNEGRAGGKPHEATDILAERGTPIQAMDDGVIEKLFLSKPGGLTVYQFDREGVFCFYYAHLDRYAEGLKEGQSVRSGDVLGYVGTTGNAPANTPHLHLAIFRLGPEKKWWKGTPIDPYPVLVELVIRELGHSQVNTKATTPK